MESFGRENLKEMNLGGINFKMEEKNEKEKPMEELLEDYLFEQKEDFKPKHLRRLAKLESYYHAPKSRMVWRAKEERERCELRKGLEMSLLGKEPGQIAEHWANNEGEYCATYGRARQEAEEHYGSLKNGINNEIIANKLLRKILGSEVGITSSKIDMNNKIDLFAFSDLDKTILAIQVKSNSRKNIVRGNDAVIEEVKSNVKEPNKRYFFKGCLESEKELKQKDKAIEFKKIWLYIPPEDKIGEGGEYNPRLEKEVKEGLGQILKKKL